MNKRALTDLSLRSRIHEVFRYHVEEKEGLIIGHERLLNEVIGAVQDWITNEENVYRAEGCEESAEALRDLRDNLTEPLAK